LYSEETTGFRKSSNHAKESLSMITKQISSHDIALKTDNGEDVRESHHRLISLESLIILPRTVSPSTEPTATSLA